MKRFLIDLNDSVSKAIQVKAKKSKRTRKTYVEMLCEKDVEVKIKEK